MLKQAKMDFPLDLTFNKKLNVAHINICTEAEGPYRRMAIWFQGCDIRCEGCCNPELQEIKVAHVMTVKEIVDIAILSKQDYGIEGVTFLGGEPTLQNGLSYLAKALALYGLGIILFTGKSYEELDENIVNSVDLIIDGKFDYKCIDENRNLIGSKNQRIIYVTDRYLESEDWFLSSRNKRVEINFSDTLFVTGDVI